MTRGIDRVGAVNSTYLYSQVVGRSALARQRCRRLVNGAKRTATRVLIADDHPIICSALESLLACEPRLAVCATAENGARALTMARETKPDVAILDLGLPDIEGPQLIAAFRDTVPTCSILVFSGRDETIYAERCIRAGAAGYVQKSVSAELIIEAIVNVSNGETWISPRMTALVLERQLRRAGSEPQRGFSSLTDREIQVFRLIGAGLSVRDIAKKVGLSPKTIETHRRRIKAKLSISTASELVSFAARWNDD